MCKEYAVGLVHESSLMTQAVGVEEDGVDGQANKEGGGKKRQKSSNVGNSVSTHPSETKKRRRRRSAD